MKPIAKKIRFGIRLVRAFVKQHLHLILVGIVVGVSSFFVYQRLAVLPGFLSGNKQIKIGLVGNYQEGEFTSEIAQLASLGLTKLLPNGVATSSVAKSWQVNNEGKEFKFFLRDDLVWPDGQKFTAKDVNYNIKNAQIEIISDFQLKISLKEPFSPLPALVSRPIFKKTVLGLGNYQFSNIKKSGRFLEEVKLVPVMKRKLPQLIYKFYTTEEAAKLGFKLGEIGRLEKITNLGDLKNWQDIKIEPMIYKERYAAVFFNLQNPKFEEKSFRQALAYTIHKPEDETRAYGPISPHSWTYNNKLKPYQFDLDHAKELMKDLIMPDKVELVAFSSLIQEAENIKKDWQALGIETEVKIINQLPENFEALLAVWEMPVDPDQYSLWHSTQANNITDIKNPKIDKLLEEGRKTFDENTRKEIYQEFQKTLVEECPAIFLFHPTTYTISRN